MGSISDSNLSMTAELNAALGDLTQWKKTANPWNVTKVYNDPNNGSGLLMRNMFDGIQDSPSAAFNTSTYPTSFIHNDLIVPSRVYPADGNIFYESDGWGGVNWGAPTLVALSTELGNAFGDRGFDINAKQLDWDRAVLYAHDSNASDRRAIPFFDEAPYQAAMEAIAQDQSVKADSTNMPNLYKGPHDLFLTSDDTNRYRYWDQFKWSPDQFNIILDPSSIYNGTWQNGSGNTWLQSGNPVSKDVIAPDGTWSGDSFGAGTGFHTKYSYAQLIGSDPPDPVKDPPPHFQGLNFEEMREFKLFDMILREGRFKKGGLYTEDFGAWWGQLAPDLYSENDPDKYHWKSFINLLAYLKSEPSEVNAYDPDKYYINDNRLYQTYDLDMIPWVSSFQEMITIQNTLWSAQDDWLIGEPDGANKAFSSYWGWNEIPVSKDFWEEPGTIYPYGKLTANRTANALVLPTGITLNSIESGVNDWDKVADRVGAQINANVQAGYIKDGDKIEFLENLAYKNFPVDKNTDYGGYYNKFSDLNSINSPLLLTLDGNDYGQILKGGILRLDSPTKETSRDDLADISIFESSLVNPELGVNTYDFTNSPVGFLYSHTLDIEVVSKTKAGFTNISGLYEVDTIDGGIVDYLDVNSNGSFDEIINPGDEYYMQAALKNVLPDSLFYAGGASSVDFNGSQSGTMFKPEFVSPFIIANAGSLEGSTASEKIDSLILINPFNDGPSRENYKETSNAYFTYALANPDNMNHVKLYEDGSYGFEDLARNIGVSDNDFNDVRFSYSFEAN